MIIEIITKLFESSIVLTDSMRTLYLSVYMLLYLSCERAITMLKLVMYILPHLPCSIEVYYAFRNKFIHNIDDPSANNVVAS